MTIYSENTSYRENIYLFPRETNQPQTVDKVEFFRDIATSKNITELKTRVMAVIRRLGFSDYSFSRLNLNKIVDLPLTTLNKDLHITYHKEKLYEHDMVLDYVAAGNLAPIFHSAIKEAINKAPFVTRTLLRNQEILNLNRRFGYEDAYLIPMKTHASGNSALFTVFAKGVKARDFQQRIKQLRPILHLLAEAVDYVGTTRFPDFFSECKDLGEEIVITPMPLRLLNLLAKEDLSLKDAALRLNISLDTANKHIAAAKNALGVKTQAAAVYRACLKGLIK